MKPVCPICGYFLRKEGFKVKNDTEQQYYSCNGKGHPEQEQRYFYQCDLQDAEIITENVKYKKEKQKFQDSNRIERKSFREYARIENAITEYAKKISEQNKEFAKELKKLDFPKIKTTKGKNVGIIQISDWHANELIDLPHNKFDFQILSDRAKKLADEAILLFGCYDIKSVLIAHTGDVLNSDRRLDELLNQATNRAKASVLAQYVLTQFIIHLRQYFKLHIVSVMGNESRMDKEFHSNNSVVSDNYDFTIFANLNEKFEFANIKDIQFGSVDKMEEVVSINGFNFLLRHDVSKATNKQKDIQSVIGKYYLQGNPIDFVLAGHIHATRNTDLSARSSSIAGSNEYNEHNLDLIGKAAQNIFIVKKDAIHSISVDLQNVNYGSGYNIIKKLEAYNAKSADKIKPHETTFKVVI